MVNVPSITKDIQIFTKYTLFTFCIKSSTEDFFPFLKVICLGASWPPNSKPVKKFWKYFDMEVFHCSTSTMKYYFILSHLQSSFPASTFYCLMYYYLLTGLIIWVLFGTIVPAGKTFLKAFSDFQHVSIWFIYEARW